MQYLRCELTPGWAGQVATGTQQGKAAPLPAETVFSMANHGSKGGCRKAEPGPTTAQVVFPIGLKEARISSSR